MHLISSFCMLRLKFLKFGLVIIGIFILNISVANTLSVEVPAATAWIKFESKVTDPTTNSKISYTFEGKGKNSQKTSISGNEKSKFVIDKAELFPQSKVPIPLNISNSCTVTFDKPNQSLIVKFDMQKYLLFCERQ